jgi:MacB-like periplasmic core domain
MLNRPARQGRLPVYRLIRRLITGLSIFIFIVSVGLHVFFFSLLDASIFHSNQFPDRDMLFAITCGKGSGQRGGGCSIPAAVSVRDGSKSTVEELSYYSRGQNILSYPGGPAELVSTMWVSSSFFSTLREWPQLGRWFVSSDNLAAVNDLVVISDRAWREYFNARTDVVGATVRLSGSPYIVVGVMPPDFIFQDSDVEAWVLDPLTVTSMEKAGLWQSTIIARVHEGTTASQLNGSLDSLVLPKNDSSLTGLKLQALPLEDFVTTQQQRTLWIPFVISGLIAALATLSMCYRRRSETGFIDGTAYRLDGRISKRLGPLVTLLVGRAAFLFTVIALALLVTYISLLVSGPTREALQISGLERSVIGIRELIYGSLVITLATLIIELIPHSLMVPRKVPADGGHHSSQNIILGLWFRHPIYSLMITAQICLLGILIVVGDALTENLLKITRAPLGFEARDLVAVEFDRQGQSPSAADSDLLFRALLKQVRALPGIEGVAVSTTPPAGDETSLSFFPVENSRRVWIASGLSEPQVVSNSYFAVMRILLLNGRFFTERDHATSACVAVVNQSFARASIGANKPGADVMGETISLNGEVGDKAEGCTVIGIAGNVLEGGPFQKPRPEIYLLDLQHSDTKRTILVRSSRSQTVIPELKTLIASIDGSRRFSYIAPVSKRIDMITLLSRMKYQLGLILAINAFIASSIGIYEMVGRLLEVREEPGETSIQSDVGQQFTPSIMLREFLSVTIVGLSLVLVIVHGAATNKSFAPEIVLPTNFDLVHVVGALFFTTSAAYASSILSVIAYGDSRSFRDFINDCFRGRKEA